MKNALRLFRASLFTSISCAMLLIASVASFADDVAVSNGQKIAFLGDSITAAGWDSPTGYVRLVISGLKINGIDAVPIPAGIGGNKSNDMLRRIDGDVIAKKPDWLTISCGVNDVWHKPGGIPLDQYKTNMTEIVDRAQAAGIHVMILTATMIGEDLTNPDNQKLAGYNDFLRELAKQKQCLLADLSADMHAALKQATDDGRAVGHILTMDGVHMNPRGNVIMALGILKAFGLSQQQLDKARNAWLDMPDGWTAQVTYQVTVEKHLTLRQFLQLQQQAPKNDSSGVWDQLQGAFRKDVESLPILLQFRREAEQKFSDDVDQQLKQ